MAKKTSKKTMYLSPKDIRKKKSRIPLPKNKSRIDPNKKPNTKIFDFIEEIIKIPYKIRGGKSKGGLIKGKPKLAKRGF